MSTHYDLHMPDGERCESCGRYDKGEVIPFAQTAAGWRVKLHAFPERGLNSLRDWMPLILTPGARIVSEYGDQYPWVDFIFLIHEWRMKLSHPSKYGDGWADVESGADMLPGEWS